MKSHSYLAFTLSGDANIADIAISMLTDVTFITVITLTTFSLTLY